MLTQTARRIMSLCSDVAAVSACQNPPITRVVGAQLDPLREARYVY